MERESTKHGRRLDEELARSAAPITHGAPVESRSRDDLVDESPADEDGARLSGGVRPDVPEPAGMPSAGEIDRRARLASYLRPGAFPATGREVKGMARAEGAPADVIDALGALPERASFNRVEDVWEEMGGHREPDRDGRRR